MRKQIRALKSKLKDRLQPVFYRAKIRKHCRKALGDLDTQIEKYVNFKCGFFVEAGANDGIKQSNTYYLEAIKGWHGILIEPIPELHKKCAKSRPNSQCINSALVSKNYNDATVVLEYADLMTMVSSQCGNRRFDASHIAVGREIQSIHESKHQKITSRAETMDQVFQRLKVCKIDFMSLDMEGYEIEALRGLSLDKYAPDWLLIEVRNMDEIWGLLSDHYSIVSVLNDNKTYKDILFKKK